MDCPILVANLPNPDATFSTPFVMFCIMLPRGVNPPSRSMTESLTVSNIVNTPLKTSLIFLAAESVILIFSVNVLNLLVNSTSFFPVIGGNTSWNALFTEPRTLPKLVNTFPNPDIIASLPPLAFQNSNTLFLASADLSIISPRDSDKLVHNLVDWSLLPKICSKDVAHPEPTCSFKVSISLLKDVTSVAAFFIDGSLAILFIVAMNTSAVNHPSFNVSLNALVVSTFLPIALAVFIISSCISLPPIPACSSERQSCS